MPNMLDMLNQALGSGGAARQIGQQLGLDEATANKAIAGALPMILGSLAKNSRSGGGDALASALDRDHDGSVLGDVAGFLGKGQAADIGSGILRHVLGGKRDAAASGLGKMSGIDSRKAAMVMSMLAPLVMGALGKARKERNLDSTGIGDMLQRNTDRIQRREPAVGGILGSLLDQDGDGSIGDDVAKLGAGFLGRMLSGRR